MLQQAFDFGEFGPEWPLHEQPVFFCIKPTVDAAGKSYTVAVDLSRRIGVRAKPTEPEKLHISLCGIGDYRRSLVRRRLHAAESAAGKISFPAFDVTFEQIMTFRGGNDGRHPIVAGGFNAPLREFHQVLAERLRADGVRVAQDVTPHMTLLYAREPIPPEPIEPLQFRAEEFVLIRSIQGRGEHRLLGRWPLRAQ